MQSTSYRSWKNLSALCWVGGALIRVNTSTVVLPTMIAGGLHIENVNIGFWLIKLYKIWNKESNIP
ncbi:hypothetical protein GQ55_1G115900 [Panicum hallii var. hallii]|uniref:Uncharacterized protein n=1 Tax=Panicum hallii var. hallii TaxID=1504633 RepID=A0A2T7F4P7_9POAL|nr:hypothetical protein GQ55_1G115900 [Panicum hallii var. hallii]